MFLDDKLVIAIGTAVRQRRKSMGMTQRQLEQRAKLGTNHVSQLENGVLNLDLVDMCKLAEALLYVRASQLMKEAEGFLPAKRTAQKPAVPTVVRKSPTALQQKAMIYDRVLGQVLRQCRLKQKLNKNELAGRSGVASLRISNIESAEATPSFSEVFRLTQALDVDLKTFVAQLEQAGKGVSLGNTVERHRENPRRLSERELEILELMAEGATNPGIARALAVSPETIKTHIRHIMEKLEVASRLEASVQALKMGLLANRT